MPLWECCHKNLRQKQYHFKVNKQEVEDYASPYADHDPEIEIADSPN